MNRTILALDTTNLKEAIDVTKKIKNKIFTVKLGLEFFNAHGKNGIKEFNKIGVNNLMLDLKLKDIPETVYKSIKALNDIEFGFLTIHGQGGKKLIENAIKAASEIKSKPKIMMVTILTSLSDDDLKDMGNENTVIEQVEKLAKIASEMKIGVVCSGHEAKIVRKIIGLRYFNVYGKGQNRSYAGVITKFLDKIDNNENLEIFGVGAQVRDFIFVEDVARANISAMISKVKNGFFNVGTGEKISIEELGKMMIKISKSTLNLKYIAPLDGDVNLSQADKELSKKLLGWESKKRLQSWLKDIFQSDTGHGK